MTKSEITFYLISTLHFYKIITKPLKKEKETTTPLISRDKRYIILI